MAQGIQVFDSNGTLILDSSDRIMTYLGVLTLTASSPNGTASVTDPRLSLGTPWYFATTNGGSWGGAVSNTITISGNTITITTSNPSYLSGSLFLTYGVY